MKRPVVGIGDFVRAHAALRPEGAAVAVLADLCGLSVPQAGTAATSSVPPIREQVDRQEVTSKWLDESALLEAAAEADVEWLTPTHRARIPLGRRADPLARESTSPQLPIAPRFVGLMSRRETVAALSYAEAVPTPSEHIDVKRLVDALSRAEVVRELPRIEVPAPGRGAHLLVDIGEPMQPFIDDQESLVAELKRLLHQGISVRYFADDPVSGAGPSPRRSTWRPYQPPAWGVPLIVLSDLGHGVPFRPHAARRWWDFARRMRGRGSRLVVFAPVRAARLNKPLQRLADIVVWDRGQGRRALARLSQSMGK